MVGTIYSQSFEDWKNSKKWDQGRKQLIPGMQIKANVDSVYKVLEEVLKNKQSNKAKAAQLLDTFCEDIEINKNNINTHFGNIEKRLGGQITKENLATYLFTHNPSPARLYRIWKETEEFFKLVTSEIKTKVYSQKWERISFKINNSNFNLVENAVYIIREKELEPENLIVLHKKDGEFYTIESLDKFKFNNKSGVDAIEDAFKNKEIYWLAMEDEPDKNLLENRQAIRVDNITKEDYYPVIEITRSPLLLRLIIPASDSMKILELIVKLYNERFEKVLGKLPLNVGLLVSKRKFPLYVLLAAGERLFQTKEFKESIMMDVWWDITGNREDKYYGFYPVRKLNVKEKYTLDELAPISKGKPYALYPGYFDFELLIGTQDRFNITYREIKRIGEDFKLFSNRPYCFYHISQIIDLWGILKDNISSSQINFIEKNLTNKLREWRNIEDSNKEDVFRKFTEATLKDAFAGNWQKLKKETQDFILNSALNGLLLDTIVLFRHIIKEKEEE